MSKVAEIFDSMDYGPAPESAKQAQKWIDGRKGTFDCFINNKFVKPASGKYFDSINPATEEKLGKIAQAGEKEVDAAVAAARKAQPEWEALGGHGRARYIYALARLVQKHGRLLSVLETMDNGKPIRETRDIDIPLVARHFYHHAGWAELLEEEFPGYIAHGVVGQVIPWNFPLLMLAWKVAPALAAGNTIVLKPAEQTSLTASLFAELCLEAGLPKGVFNIVTGDGKTGGALTGHKGVDKVAFTGSTEVGRIIRKATAGTGKHLTLELGGKSPFIVFDDADLDSAVEGVVDAIWFNQGEVCCGGSRILVQESVSERFIEKLKTRLNSLRVGDPLDKCIDMGAVVDKTQLKRITSLVEQGVREGAEKWQPANDCPSKGCFFPPTLLTNVSPAATVAQEEIFGPVVAAMTFRTHKEAIELANNTRYGLAASVWTDNINMALEMAPKIKCGVVWVNSTNLFDAAVGFGGYRESGFGREGGKEGMYAYLRPAFENDLPAYEKAAKKPSKKTYKLDDVDHIDRTAKNYIGGKQKRPDGNYSMPVLSPDGELIGQVGEGNRKDIRDAVEAARKASGWATATAHNKAQILYYIAENLDFRRDEFAARITEMTGATKKKAQDEVDQAIQRIFSYAAWADKYDGQVHNPPMRGVALAMNEPTGIIGIVCPDENPLLGFVSLAIPAITMGNRIVAVPSETHPLSATDFYQVLETSDLPGGVLNIVTGEHDTLSKTLAEHDELDAMWYFGRSAQTSKFVEEAAAANIKRTWVSHGRQRDWTNNVQGQGKEFLRQATEVKNIWVPYGE